MACSNLARCLSFVGQHSKSTGDLRPMRVVDISSINFKLFRSSRLLRNSILVSAALGAKAESTTEGEQVSAPHESRRTPSVFSPELDLIDSIHSDTAIFPENKFLSAWAKSKDVIVGRVAKFGVAAALVMELITGQGPVSHMGLLEVDQAILFLLGFILIAALLPINSSLVPGKKNIKSPSVPKSMLDINQAGVCRENELALGRMSQLGLAAVLIGEAVTGKGILAHMEIQTGVPLCDTDPLVIIFITFILLSAISPGNRKLD